MHDTQLARFLPAGTLYHHFDHGSKVAGEYFLLSNTKPLVKQKLNMPWFDISGTNAKAKSLVSMYLNWCLRVKEKKQILGSVSTDNETA